MDFKTKVLKVMTAKTESEIDDAIGLFTDKQKDMLIRALLKCCTGAGQIQTDWVKELDDVMHRQSVKPNRADKTFDEFVSEFSG